MTTPDQVRRSRHAAQPCQGEVNDLAGSPTNRRDSLSIGQHPPIGPIPSNARLLLSGLIWANSTTVLAALQLVYPTDLDQAHGEILDAIAKCAESGSTGPRAILDRLTREGRATQSVSNELVHAATAGGIPEQWQQYAAQVLAERFRAACESFAQSVLGWTADGSESELWHGITSAGTQLRLLADRLTNARGSDL